MTCYYKDQQQRAILEQTILCQICAFFLFEHSVILE